jgi:uncharacterized membrane protein (DUF485 family)
LSKISANFSKFETSKLTFTWIAAVSTLTTRSWSLAGYSLISFQDHFLEARVLNGPLASLKLRLHSSGVSS